MAARGGGSVALVVTLTIFIILTVGFLITSVIFYSQFTKAQGEREQLEADFAEILPANQRRIERVELALEQAQRPAEGEDRRRQSLVEFLLEERERAMTLAAGNPQLTSYQLGRRIESQVGESSSSLLDRVSLLDGRVGALSAELASKEAEIRSREQDVEGQIDVIRTAQRAATSQIQQATDQVGAYKADVDDYRDQIDTFEATVAEELDRTRSEFQRQVVERDRTIAEQADNILLLQDIIKNLTGERESESLRPIDEFALVDGRVAAVDPINNTVTIDLGREDNLVIGITFSVYNAPQNIRPDETGEYPAGKAVVEVIRIQENAAIARIVRESRGNPIVAGDVIANPVYDPEKVYSFVVYGNFDTDRDGVATPLERDEIEALIESWGGRVGDDITGDLDFLVLGRKPALPPQPSPGAPIEVINEYARLDGIIQRYDELLERAADLSIPVLNENRLRTLVGVIPR